MEVTDLAPIQQFLSRLNSDTWSQVLLPKLIKQASAGAVALTCSQLRDVMYHGVQQVDLSSLTGYTLNPAEAKWLVRFVPQRFPGCTSVQLHVDSKKACTVAGSVLPALKRLPSLNDIKTTVPGPLPLTPLGTLLYSMHKQLKSLHSLSLVVQQQGCAGAERVWQALGRFTQLTALVIEFGSEVPYGCTGKDLDTLCSLTQLRSIDIVTGGYDLPETQRTQPLLTSRLLRPLTALTSLKFDVCTLDDMVCVSGCTALQRLIVGCNDGDEMEMRHLHWHALRQLTSLTLLNLYNALVYNAPPACFDALQRLQRLQEFSAWVMSAPLLPALAACTQLTSISGAWSQPAPDVGGSCCGAEMGSALVALPSIVELYSARGAVPFAAFPNLQEFFHDGTLELSSVQAMVSCCTGLRTLDSCTDESPEDSGVFCSLPSDEPTGVRVACLQSFTSMHNLQGLSLSVHGDAELVALASAACHLIPYQLEHLSIILPVGTNVTVCGLCQLARVQGIDLLALGFLSDTLVSTESDAFMVLCALWGAASVLVEVAAPLQKQLMDAAWAELTQSGLPRPRDITIQLARSAA